MDKVCLTCRNPGNLCNLTSQEYEDAARKFATLITLQIQAKDSLPWYICRKCIETLNTVHEFLRCCKEAEQRMREELGRPADKTHEELQMTISAIKKESADTMEEEQLLHENTPGIHTTEKNLVKGGMNLDENQKNIFLEEPKLAEPTHTESGLEKGSELHQNMKTHGNDRLQQRDRNFSCQSCQKLYVSYHTLNKHVRKAHVGKKPFVCNVCGKDFPQEADLEAHNHPCKQSLKQKQFMLEHVECEFCGRNFLDRGQLNQHRRTHTKEKPYGCNVCHKKFSRTCNLKRHRLIHSDERPYKCNQCNKAFRRQSYLKLHNSVHGGKKPFECTICMKGLRHRQSLIQHMRTHQSATVRQSVSKSVTSETSSVMAEERMVKVKLSEAIEYIKKEDLSDECV